MVSQINEEQSERREGRSVILHGWVGQLVQGGEGGWSVGYVQERKEQIETGRCGGKGGNRTIAGRMKSAQETEGEQQEGEARRPEELPTSEGDPFCPAGRLVPIHESSLPGVSQLLVQRSNASASWLDRITPFKYIITIPSLSLRLPLCCVSPLVRLRKQELRRAARVRGEGWVLDGEPRPSRGRDRSVRGLIVHRVVKLPTDTSTTHVS